MTTDDVPDQALQNEEVRAALDGALAATPGQLVSRGSFAVYADDEEDSEEPDAIA